MSGQRYNAEGFDSDGYPVVQQWRESAVQKMVLWVSLALALLVFFTTMGMRAGAPKLEGYNGTAQTFFQEYKFTTCEEMNFMTGTQRTVMAGDYLRLARRNLKGNSGQVTVDEAQTHLANMVAACNTLAPTIGHGYLSDVYTASASSLACYNHR